MGTVYTRLQESISFIKSQVSEKPEVGVVLGSGWQGFLQEIEAVSASGGPGIEKTPQEINLSTVPHCLPSWAGQKKGSLIIGKISLDSPFTKGGERGIIVACLGTRLHTYEGFTTQEVAYPIRVLGALGIKTLFITNAAGGINRGFSVGSLMLIKDHINIAGEDPTRLVTPTSVSSNVLADVSEEPKRLLHTPLGFAWEETELVPRFLDMSQAYDPELIRLAEVVAKGSGIRIRKGVYAGVKGPSYETPAEVRMLRILGADAVGMSTIPEVIAARQMGIRVCGISCITNKAAGLSKEKITHEEVLAVMERVGKRAFKLLREVIGQSARL